MKKVFCLILMLAGCGSKVSSNYVLYRNNPIFPDLRIHIATFDSSEESYEGKSNDYNKYNCSLVKSLIKNFYKKKSKVGKDTKVWCEKKK